MKNEKENKGSLGILHVWIEAKKKECICYFSNKATQSLAIFGIEHVGCNFAFDTIGRQ